jgi:hypothetical protein
MNLSSVFEWLKGTITGIVLLSAVGSIIAVLLISAAKKFLLPLAGVWSGKLLRRLLRHFIKPAVQQLVRLRFLPGQDSAHQMLAYYTLQLMKFGLALFVSTGGLFFFAAALAQPYGSLFRSVVFFPAITSFLGFWYALRCLAVVLLPLYVDMQPMIEDAEAQARAGTVSGER